MKQKRNNYRLIFFYLAAGILALVVRLYHLNSPVADWHSWRQSDTAAVARNFEMQRIDFLRPRYDDLSNIQSGHDNPNGWRMVEMPVYQAAGVLLHRVNPGMSLEANLRLVSILSVSGSVVLIGLLLYSLVGPEASVFGALLYAVLPYSIYYGRTILPDAFGTFWVLLSLALVVSETESYWFLRIVLSAACAGISLLVRPMEVFVLLPLLLFVVRLNKMNKTIVSFIVYGVIVFLPIYLWRNWILQFPEGIPVSDWLYNKGNIRFKGAWFYWLFSNRLGDLILGNWGLIPFAAGIVRKIPRRAGIFSFLWFAGMILYFIIFAGGNVQHDYYQALIIPVLVWFMAIGLDALYHAEFGGVLISRAIAIVSIIFLWMFSWYTIRTYFWINRPEIIQAGIDADKRLPPGAKVIAPYNGDTTFLYQTRRPGWPLGFDIDQKITMGAQYYVTVSPHDSDTETRDLAKKYTVLVRNDTYAIIDLTRLNQPGK